MVRCDECGKNFKTTQGLAGHRSGTHHRRKQSQAGGTGPAAGDRDSSSLQGRVHHTAHEALANSELALAKIHLLEHVVLAKSMEHNHTPEEFKETFDDAVRHVDLAYGY